MAEARPRRPCRQPRLPPAWIRRQRVCHHAVKNSAGTDRANGVTRMLGRNEPQRAEGEESIEQPDNIHIFFSIYFLMTGIHALHVIIGMVVISWVPGAHIQGRIRQGLFQPD